MPSMADEDDTDRAISSRSLAEFFRYGFVLRRLCFDMTRI